MKVRKPHLQFAKYGSFICLCEIMVKSGDTFWSNYLCRMFSS